MSLKLPQRPRANAWAAAHGLSDKTVLLYSGTMGLKHDPELLVHLARRFKDRPDVRVVVVSTISPQPPMVADELRRQADQFVDIIELQPKIGRDPAERAAREAREPRERQHTPQFLQRSTPAPQRAGADDDFED